MSGSAPFPGQGPNEACEGVPGSRAACRGLGGGQDHVALPKKDLLSEGPFEKPFSKGQGPGHAQEDLIRSRVSPVLLGLNKTSVIIFTYFFLCKVPVSAEGAAIRWSPGDRRRTAGCRASRTL